MADDAGALLVRSGLVPPSALDDARVRVTSQGGTIGEQLVAAGAIGDDALTDFYRSRLLVPQVNPNTLARLPMRVVQTIPSDMAIELRVIPVSLDRDNNLTVAMSDPSDRHAVDEIAFFTGNYVIRAVATQMQIAWCLAHYYGHITGLGQRLLQPTDQASPRIASAPPATTPPPRARGHTDQIRAMRHRAIAPIEAPRELATPTAPGAPAPAPAPAPERPRTNSVSGEIRVPVRRAPSIRPPVPDPLEDSDDSDPVITVEPATDDGPATERKLAPRPRRPQKPNPPELAARAGEVEIQSTPTRVPEIADEPRIIIADDEPPPAPVPTPRASTPPPPASPEPMASVESAPTIQVAADADEVVIHARLPEDEEPVALDRPRAKPSVPPPAPQPPAPAAAAAAAADDDEVVVLEARKPRRIGRPERKTQVGIGVLPAVTRRARDTEAAPPSMLEDDPTGVRELRLPDRTKLHGVVAPSSPDDTSDEALAAPPGPLDVGDETSPTIAPPAPGPRAPSSPSSADGAGDDDDDEVEIEIDRVTSVMTAAELDEAIPERSSDVVPAHLARHHDYDPVDDGWGPPGTTIPPPLLGAIPGAVDDDDRRAGVIPVADVDSAPLIVTPPAPPEARGVATPDSAAAAAALEEATARSLELIRALEHARTRDDVLELMIAHLASSHRRAGFLSIKNGELGVFQMRPRPEVIPVSTLRLDRPSTLQDVVGTRLPYRGPMHDDASRNFLAAVLGACPPEILLVPMSVRDRVVGVLYGERRARHTFDDQLALAARAAGMALERILKTKRG